MGREVRRVPPNWEHPVVERQYGREGYQPMCDRHAEDAQAEWLADFDRIRAGKFKGEWEQKYYAGPLGCVRWARDETAPAPDYCRPWRDEDATWFQVWETVSEGTPITPPFETEDELVSYLAENGDFWDQKRGDPPPSREAAEKFVKAGWAPSMVVIVSPEGSTVKAGIEALP